MFLTQASFQAPFIWFQTNVVRGSIVHISLVIIHHNPSCSHAPMGHRTICTEEQRVAVRSLQMTKQHHFQMTKQDPWYENHYPHMTQQEHWFEKLKDGALFLNFQIQVLCLLIHNMFIVHHIAQKRQNAACWYFLKGFWWKAQNSPLYMRSSITAVKGRGYLRNPQNIPQQGKAKSKLSIHAAKDSEGRLYFSNLNI